MQESGPAAQKVVASGPGPEGVCQEGQGGKSFQAEGTFTLKAAK